MRKRWAVINRDCDGEVHQRHEFVFKHSARRFADMLGGRLSLESLLAEREVFKAQIDLYGVQVLERMPVPRTFTVELFRV